MDGKNQVGDGTGTVGVVAGRGLTATPRARKMSSRDRRRSRAERVALATLAALLEPRDLLRTFRMPAASRTARTVLPAMTPVPSLAGRKSTRAPSKFEVIS